MNGTRFPGARGWRSRNSALVLEEKYSQLNSRRAGLGERALPAPTSSTEPPIFLTAASVRPNSLPAPCVTKSRAPNFCALPGYSRGVVQHQLQVKARERIQPCCSISLASRAACGEFTLEFKALMDVAARKARW